MRAVASLCAIVMLTTACGRVEPDACAVCEAALAGDVNGVRHALGVEPSDVRARTADAALYRLATGASPSVEHVGGIARMLFGAGANPHQDRVFRTTGRSRAYILEDVAQRGDAALVQAFIDAGFDVKGEPGVWVLLRAVAASANEVTRVLVAAGADANRRLLDTTAAEQARAANDAETLALLEGRP